VRTLYKGRSTGVGAILRFFVSRSDASSFSLSLASPGLFVPAPPVVLAGVSGGVVMGTPVTLPEFVAAILGT
jgi:tellurite resistance protein TehA-like permease